MRIFLSLLAVPLLLTSNLEAKSNPRLKLGASMPAFNETFLNVDGKELKLADVKGKKGTLVIFSCNHCPFVKAWEDRIVALGNESLAKGFGVIQINSNDPSREKEDSFEKMQERGKQKGMKFPYVVDATSNAARAFGATKTPELFLFDAKGTLVYTGAIDDNSEEPQAVEERFAKDAIEAVLAGKPVTKGETKAIGCGIKFRKSNA